MGIAVQRHKQDVQVEADDVRPGDIYRFIGTNGKLSTGTVLEVSGGLVCVREWANENEEVYWTPKQPYGGAKIVFWRKVE